MLVRVEELNATSPASGSSTPPSAARSRAGRAGRASSGFTGDFAEYLAQKFKTSTAADFAVLEAGVVSEETYVEQGLYWSTAHLPMLEYVVETYKPDLLLVGMPTTDEFQHQFLGLVSPKLPGGAPNPAYDDVDLNGVPRTERSVAGTRATRRSSPRARTVDDEADEVDSTRARRRLRCGDADPTTFVSSDHGFAPQFLGVDASKPLVELGLLSRPQTSNCRPATGETIGKAKACYAGGALQIYLNVVGPRPGRRRLHAGPGEPGRRDRRRDQGEVPRPHRPERLDARRPARGLEDDRPRLHEGGGAVHPERAELDDGHGPSDADGRPRRVLVPAVPVRRGDAGHARRPVALLRAARLRAGRPGSRREHQHAGDVPRRRRGHREG